MRSECLSACIHFALFFLILCDTDYLFYQFESARKIWPLLELLAKIRWVLACSCKSSHARIFLKIPCRVAYKRKHNLYLENKNWHWKQCSRMGNWETSGKHARAMNVSRNAASSFCWCLLKLTALSSVPGSRVILYLKHFACKGGLSLTLLRGNLLACIKTGRYKTGQHAQS